MALGAAMFVDRLGRRTLFVSSDLYFVLTVLMPVLCQVISNAGMLCGKPR